MSWPWSELGLSGPAGLPEIRKAYARRLKDTHPEEDPEGFQRLHSAYQEASRRARRLAVQAEAKEPPPASASPAPKAEPEAGWDYDQLLKEEARKTQEAQGETRAPDWDYDQLLEGAGEARKEAQEEARAPDWDYERLFAEGEAEAQAARRRKLEELRRKNKARLAAQEKEQRKRAKDDEEVWASVCAAAHALELLYSTGAPLRQWVRFLNDPVFWNVQTNLDFLFALEDFLEQRPDLPLDIRKAIFAAYESRNASKYPVYKRLYKLLGVDAREKRRIARSKSAWRAEWRSFPLWRKAVVLISLSVLAAFFVLALVLNPGGSSEGEPGEPPGRPWKDEALEWLEADYGEPFVYVASDDIFAPASDPELYFWAIRNSKRSAGWPGYQTDYPYVRVRQALEDFAEERELALNLSGYTGDIGDAPEAYLLNLPLLGAEEDIAALGERIEELASRSWHQLSAASRRQQQGIKEVGYKIFLCHGGLAFYDAYAPKGFDTEEALSLYAQAGPAFCRYILENSGLADQHMGEDAYVLLDQGTVEIGGGTFFLVGGADKESYEPKVEYLLAEGGGMLFCLPEGRLEKVSGIVDLYRGNTTHLQLDGVGLVIVLDQVKTE